MASDFDAVLDRLTTEGALLLSDPRLPSVAALVAGEPVRGSWWGHPAGGAIYRVCGLLGDHPDVATARLFAGKVTFLHRQLWPALYAVATSRECWQLVGLTNPARTLLEMVDSGGDLRTDHPPQPLPKPGDAARELEARLLAHGEGVHTERGSHAKRLRTWSRWASDTGFTPTPISAQVAQAELEALAIRWSTEHGAPCRLPWTLYY